MILKRTTSIILALIIGMCFVSCADVTDESAYVTDEPAGDLTVTGDLGKLWAKATYTEDTELGTGSKTVSVKVSAPDHSITFTLHTDADTLGDALAEQDLVSGEQGAYGLYVKSVNGIEADYDKNQAYWGFNKNGESMMVGVDSAKISDGESYELVYTE